MAEICPSSASGICPFAGWIFLALPQTQDEIYQYVTTVRDEQQVPLIIMDIKQDTLMIDQVISEGVCLWV